MLSVVAQARPHTERAAEHASSPVIRADPDMEVEEATQRMVRHGVRRLVVVSGGSVAGVVTLDDLSSRGLEPELSRRASRELRYPSPSHARGG